MYLVGTLEVVSQINSKDLSLPTDPAPRRRSRFLSSFFPPPNRGFPFFACLKSTRNGEENCSRDPSTRTRSPSASSGSFVLGQDGRHGLLQRYSEQVAGTMWRREIVLVATTSDVVEVATSVPAAQFFGHGGILYSVRMGGGSFVNPLW
jgi:hypothetical protein